MVSSGMLHRVALVRTDVSEEPSASFIRVTRIGELGTTQAAMSNQRTLRINTNTNIVLIGYVKTLYFNVFQIDEPGSVQYGLMGTNTCMGDHKVNIYFKLLVIMVLYLIFI
jgi:hypothetical protein